MINIIIADDQEIVRKGIKMQLSSCDEINILDEVENGKQLLLLLEKMSPDIILMDVKMPLIGGIKATKIIKEKYKNLKVIILTTFKDDKYILEAIKCGADGYILKDVGSEYLVNAIKSAYNGSIFLDPQVTTKVVQAFKSISCNPPKDSRELITSNDKLAVLTPREIDVATLISEGKSNKDICKILFLSEGTVKNYVTKILSKLELKSRTELALFINRFK